MLSNIRSEPLAFFVEAALLLLYILGAALLYLFRIVDLDFLVVCFDLLTGFLLIRSWNRFHGGLHPCWLFLVGIAFFQGGALLGYLFGDISDPFLVTMMFITPVSIAEPYKAMTILCVALSMVCIYLPCAFRVTRRSYSADFSRGVRKATLFIYYLLLPFEMYKVWAYVSFIQSHGGYAANLLMNTELHEAAGLPVRLASFVCAGAFYLLLLIETRRSILKYVYITFIGTLLLSLGIGDRGGVLTHLVMIWYVHKFKTGKSFKFAPLIIIGCLGAILSALVGQMRSNEELQATTNVLSFITGQGLSLQVTELAIAERARFAPHAVSYLLHGSGLFPGEIRPGQMFNLDLPEYLSNVRVQQGLGTGSTFIAEAYLLGGVLGVVIVSLCIGFALRLLYVVSDRKYGLAPTIMFLAALVFVPRAEILSPLRIGLQIGVGMALVGAAAHFCAKWLGFLKQSATDQPRELNSATLP